MEHSYLLEQLDLYNWGAFEGRHQAAIDPRGSAIIGPTGSGKTTLVDALMTLLTEYPRYNLASTGGHESDRDLISYVRGVTGPGSGSGNEHINRPGKTVTGIAARFNNGEHTATLAALFWIDGNSSAMADMKRLWIFSQTEGQGLDSWLEIHHQGGARALKQLGRETTGMVCFDSKQAYLARVRTLFEVGENAFTLLNRAAGLKQLNSIDEIFRELVLDDHAAFARAAEVAGEFDDLAAIHGELELARQQLHSLQPIAERWQRHQRQEATLERLQGQDRVLERWFAEQGAQLVRERIASLDGEHQQCSQQLTGLESALADLVGEENTLRDRYLQAGGANIEQMREQIVQQRALITGIDRYAQDYRRLARALELDETLSAAALHANQQRAQQEQARAGEALTEKTRAAYGLGAVLARRQDELEALQQEHQQVQARPGSNLPPAYQGFRHELAEALGLEEEALPFVAELIAVREEEGHWRGAIERALGGQRLRILVPPEAMEQALTWINARHNRLHVRLLEAVEADQPVRFFEDGFARKLRFKAHQSRGALKKLLAGLDRHCVDTPEQLRHVEHGMTVQGLMSGKAYHFDKQDQRRLEQDWMTGFDNRDRLASLDTAIREAQAHLAEAQTQARAAEGEVEAVRQRQALWQRLLALDFEQIDLPGAEERLRTLERRLATLEDPHSDAGRALAELQQVEQRRKGLEQQRDAVRDERTRLVQRREDSQERLQGFLQRLGDGLNEAERVLAGELPRTDRLEALEGLERDTRNRLRGELNRAQGALLDSAKELVRLMGRARSIDSGALAEVGSELVDVPAYLDRLRLLSEEALPAKLRRFTDYLNQSSDQGVTQLLMDLENEVSRIEERIDELNQTLQRVDFQPARYLRLEPRRVVHERLRTLQQAQKNLRSAALKDDQGESHFKALQEMVALLREAAEGRKTLWARHVLDPRYRLQFAVSVIDRDSGTVLETRTGSQGGSGGEKEIIASYVLTASLSYALCPEGSTRPLFSTIVLDEAFSKSSQAVAGRIISALDEFGLHPLFVTPNKELRLLRRHTRSAIVVHRRGNQATLTSLSWEALAAQAEQRKADHAHLE
ncbi:MAG: ATP-binding protein [Thiohalomonadaceae bacterium]